MGTLSLGEGRGLHVTVTEELEFSPSQMDPRAHAEQKKVSESREPSLHLTAMDTSPESVRAPPGLHFFWQNLGLKSKASDASLGLCTAHQPLVSTRC